MVSKYSTKLVEAVRGATQYRLGTELANICIAANLPAAYVAQVLGVTRMTLHVWFRGGSIRMSKRERIGVFIDIVEGDIKQGRLPVKTLSEARAYLEEMTDKPITTVVKKEKQG
jgi:predicted site-specific integrase-resolvase